MVGVIQVQIDVSKVTRRFTKLDHFVRIDIPRLTFKQANDGKRYAATIAPKDSGALIQALDVSQSERGKGSTGWAVVSRTPQNIRKNNPRGVPYHAYLEYGKSVNIRNGRKQRYMKETALWLNRKYPEAIKQGLGDAINK